MFSHRVYVALLLASRSVVNAQGSTSSSSAPSITAALSPCVLGCIAGGTQCTLADINCACTNKDYQNATSSCLSSKCTQQEQAAASAAQQSQCASVTASATDTTTSKQAILPSIASKASELSASIESATHIGSSEKPELSSFGLILGMGAIVTGAGFGSLIAI